MSKLMKLDYNDMKSEELGRAIDENPEDEALWAEHQRRIREGMKLNRFIDTKVFPGARLIDHVGLLYQSIGWCRYEVIGLERGDPCYLSRKFHHIKVRRVRVDGCVQRTIQIMPAKWFMPPGFGV